MSPLVGGGTAVASSPRPETKWLIALAIGVMVTCSVVLFRVGEVNDEVEATEPPSPVLEQRQAPRAHTGWRGESRGTEKSTTASDNRKTIVSELDAELTANRIWAKVSTDSPSSADLTVVSAMCDKEAMSAALKDAAPRLRSVGFAKIHCRAKHGGLVFTTDL